MAKQYAIKQIEYNQKMAGKYNGAFLHTVAVESEAKRRDFVFENSKQFKVLQECAVGNIVELKIVKNGDFFNLAKDDDAIVLISKEKSEEVTEKLTPDKLQEIATTIASTPTKSYGGYKEDPDKQAAIIRQNALTNATNLVIAKDVNGISEGMIKSILSVAIQFAKFTSGEDMTEYLLEEDVPFVPDKPKRGPKAKEVAVEPDCGGEFGE